MRPASYTVEGVANGAPVPIDWYLNPINVSLGAQVTGTVNYIIQTTNANPFDPGFDPDTAPWDDQVEDVASATVNITAAFCAARLIITSGDGSVLFTVTQSGMPGA